MTDLSGVIVPVVVAGLLAISTAFVVSRYSGPAQTAYIAALQGRLSVVEAERNEAFSRIAKLEARIVALESQVEALTAAGIQKDRELARLYRRLDADEARLAHDERLLPNEP